MYKFSKFQKFVSNTQSLWHLRWTARIIIFIFVGLSACLSFCLLVGNIKNWWMDISVKFTYQIRFQLTISVGISSCNAAYQATSLYRNQWCPVILRIDIPIGLKESKRHCLIHWGQVTHICVGKLTITCSDNVLSPGRRQAIIWTNAKILLIGPLVTNFSEILIDMIHFHSRKCIWKCRLRNGVYFASALLC